MRLVRVRRRAGLPMSQRRNSSARARQDVKRSSGRLAIALRQSASSVGGTSRFIDLGRGGSRWIAWESTSGGGPMKGGRPQRSSYRTTPRLY